MSKITGLPDLSRFVRRVDRIKVYNTVQLVVGEVIFEVTGCVISQKSGYLEELVRSQQEIYLDQFVGEEDGIQDCIELLYGGEIILNKTNIKTIIKFSTIYQVNDMYKLCIDWIKEHISTANLFNIIELGLLTAGIEQSNQHLLELCKHFIIENVNDDLYKLSQNWSFANHTNFIRFLMQDEILYFSLPILTLWVSNDSDIRLILEQVELKSLTQVLPKHGTRTTELIKKMSEKMELFETSRKILKLQMTVSKEESACCSKDLVLSNKNLTSLLDEDYHTFSIEKLLMLEEEYDLEHFEFVDIALDWILSNKHSEEDVLKLWCNIRQNELVYDYLAFVWDTIVSSHDGIYDDIIPEPEQPSDQIEYCTGEWCIQKLSTNQKHSLFNNKTVVLKESCWKCNTMYDVKLRLEDKHPCYVLDNDSHCLVKHWYIGWFDDTDGLFHYYSLTANDYSAVIEKIKGHLETDTDIFLRCFYKCREEEGRSSGGQK